MTELWGEFFDLPAAAKEAYANSPTMFEGYGSRLGLQKDAVLDWGDYFFHNSSLSVSSHDMWLKVPPNLSGWAGHSAPGQHKEGRLAPPPRPWAISPLFFRTLAPLFNAHSRAPLTRRRSVLQHVLCSPLCSPHIPLESRAAL
ncbi:hypothetical protein KSP40_PGU016210 [Platanthera guangdongensis]|uniref:Non-haem dioxygenase N-terminal domain-containing protein n=1 Tax=Platanthera guangdongensis TaxID=2320717 RepID=A0ABR2M7N1_9ASPA